MRLNDWILKKHTKIREKPLSYQISMGLMTLLTVLGLFHSLFANDKPYLMMNEGKVSFPAFRSVAVDWGILKDKTEAIPVNATSFYPPIRYSYDFIDQRNLGFSSPADYSGVAVFWERHWLGTDQLGRDTAAGILRSIYNALRIGIFATLLSMIIGTFLGAFVALSGRNGLSLNWLQWLLILPLSFGSCFYLILFYQNLSMAGLVSLGKELQLTNLIILAVLIFAIFIVKRYFQLPQLSKYKLPFDDILVKILELRKSIPSLIILLTIMPLFDKPSITSIIVVLSFIGWTSFARIARAETINLLENDYISAARSIGVSNYRLLSHHILPNIVDTIRVMIVFTFIANVLSESSLSFLGIGLGVEDISFGSMLNVASRNLSAWWMAVFPGLILFLMLISLNNIRGHMNGRKETDLQ
jgi:peptide/nickel transport system permease protein